MIGWLLDTNVVTELTSPRGAARVHAWAASQDEASLYLSILTFGEYQKGLSHAPESAALRSRVEQAVVALEARSAGRVLPVGDAVVRRWGTISGAVKRATKQSPPVIDTMFAATALEHGLCLVTRNTRDVRHSGAATFNPWEDGPTSQPAVARVTRRRPGSR